jgi:tRNA threonylcarbamoyladenosine biosynthesis protein TsaE
VIYEINTLTELQDLTKRVLAEYTQSRIFTFTGHLGAGKTTFVKFLCKSLGCNPDDINSPTFSIVNEYLSAQGPVYHMDLYRINSIEEALDFGIEEYLFSGNFCFIEWPEIALPLLDISYYSVILHVDPSGSRKIEISLIPELEQNS